MTADERLAGPRLKAKRAEFHIQNLNAAIKAFYSTDPKPYAVGAKHDPKTRKLVHYMTRVDPAPLHLSATIGDAICNLRGTLDHLAQQFYLVGTGGSQGPSYDIAYPIFDDAAKYKSGAPGKVKGMRQDAINFIDATKPYKGGNDALWRIKKLNDADKHRALIAVAAGNLYVDVGAVVDRQLREIAPDAFEGLSPADTRFSLNMRQEGLMCPLKVGDAIYIGRPDEKPYEDMQFAFCVSLNEPSILPAESVPIVLSDFAGAVNRVLDSAGPLLA